MFSIFFRITTPVVAKILMSNHRMVPKRSIKAFVNAALWGDFETCVDFLRGTDVYSTKILDREEVLRLKLAPKSEWNEQGIRKNAARM